MKRVIGVLLCLAIWGATLAAAAEMELRGPFFVPAAYMGDRGKIMDSKHVIVGRIDNDGIVYDVTNKNLGFVSADLTVKDAHFTVLTTVDQDGKMTDEKGNAIGLMTTAKVVDGSGAPVIYYEGEINKRQVLAYLFFFSNAFGANKEVAK